MFKIKFIFCSILFITFLIITSIIKNKSRILEKQITNLNIKISSKQKNLSEAQLEFNYLSSPSKIEKKLDIIGLKEYKPISYSNIFLKPLDFLNLHNKFSTSNNLNEKKIQKKQ